MSWKASPYLFPCTIEYSLICAAVIYKMCRNVGRRFCAASAADAYPPHEHISATGVDCDKANRGLFFGLFITVLTLVAVSCYFVFDDRLYGSQSSSLTFFATEIMLLAVLSATVVAATASFRRLRFVPTSAASQVNHGGIDSSLLVIALVGVYGLECFHFVSAVGGSIDAGGDDSGGGDDGGGGSGGNGGGSGGGGGAIVSALAMGTSVLAFSQATVQTVFIVDALQRHVRSAEQARSKPGRPMVTFLLLCNLALWIVCIFEVKKAENLPIHARFYGYLAWSIISHLCVPLVIFFRFHSTVCLSDIWINAYTLKPPPSK